MIHLKIINFKRMKLKISKITEINEKCTTVILTDEFDPLKLTFFNSNEYLYVKDKLEKGKDCIVHRDQYLFYIKKIKEEKDIYLQNEDARITGSKFFDTVKDDKPASLQILDLTANNFTLPFLEGLLLSSYSFLKYKKEKDDYQPDEIIICGDRISNLEIEELFSIIDAVFEARNLVNEPLSYLTTQRLSEEIERMGRDAGFIVDVLNKKKIEALRMGGLLAVNRGSVDPPAFNILEWNPENAINKKPVILVGKGIVFDTGGLSLKPTPKSMDYMKCDMAGAAVVAATIYAAAKNKMPLHLIGLIPATDNRPDGNAYVPGDVITMFDGTTVEIKNTDAEGRLILADALSYAKKYNPSLVIDIATLTGAATIISGPYAAIAMGNSADDIQKLKQSGNETYERIIELPLWEEFAKSLKSPVADLNNLGSREAQTSVAGKFLEHFTEYPWIHLDIAGVAFLEDKDFYRPQGGTGTGTRLLYHFLKKFN
jgi:leucyl aminopeptidase